MVTVDSPEVLAWCGDLDSDDSFRFNGLRYVGGVDISFKKETPNEACAMLVVLSFPELKVWYDEHVFRNVIKQGATPPISLDIQNILQDN